ncbi:MAG: hypothetical protein EBX37_11585 [Alphaproteobacteria bacterium]|nr:hypothetical protein [Alphaproteobacteria bacterium]
MIRSKGKDSAPLRDLTGKAGGLALEPVSFARAHFAGSKTLIVDHHDPLKRFFERMKLWQRLIRRRGTEALPEAHPDKPQVLPSPSAMCLACCRFDGHRV